MNAQYERIKRLCEQQGITVSALAEKCGVSRSIFTHLKDSGESLSGKILVQISLYLGVSTDYLLGLEPEPEADPDPELGGDDDDD